jgi:branched-chain amino acid transport system substrate-binding protein
MLMVLALSGTTDPAKLAAYLRDEVEGAPGITGPIGFTGQGDREGVPFYLYVVDDQGKIVVSR